MNSISTMTFDRWKSTWPRTWPQVLFKQHHTELNNLYWALAAAGSNALTSAAPAPGSAPLSTALKTSTANARRVNFTIDEWRAKFKESENWTRLNALVALTGYLETYLHAIVTLALTSDPGVLLSSPRSVDGIRLVKERCLPDISSHVTGVTKGTWHERVACYEKLFGSPPLGLVSHVRELEAMRNMRNGVGHAFGRLIDEYRSPLLLATLPVQRLAESRLQKWLSIVEEVVSEIDQHLRNTHVGASEALLHYHHWDKKFPAGHMSEHQALRSRFPDLQGMRPSPKYFQQVIAHYRSL